MGVEAIRGSVGLCIWEGGRNMCLSVWQKGKIRNGMHGKRGVFEPTDLAEDGLGNVES